MSSSSSSSEPQVPLLDEFLDGLETEYYTNPATTVTQSTGTLCEAKVLYEGPSKCNCCINWVEQYPTITKETAEETSDVKRYAILCRLQKAHGATTRALELQSIVIQNPLLKSVLGGVFAGYPSITTTLEKLEFCAPFWEFFYRWQALADAQDTHEGDALAQIRLLLNELTSQLGSVHGIAADLVQNNVMTYDFLWTLFPPATLVYSRILDRDCLLEVQKTTYDTRSETYDLQCKYVEWDGEKFGWRWELIEIPKFSGTQSIQDLKAYPVTHHKAPKDTELQLLERGRKFVSLSNCQQNLTMINERIMVDAKAFLSHAASSADLDPLDSNDLGSQPGVELSDRLLMLCSPVVKACALKSKCWGEVDVDGISDINWDENVFHNLVLEKETKQLIESFVFAQIRARNDNVAYGEPGIGKTLTAETIAEKAQRPLYVLSAGDLGTSSEQVEERLAEIFDLAYKWNAVLLLDESDVFLEQRTSDNLERNQLVSVFLRMLEYYRGILFLTTNRVSVFDAAFQSRIHFTLHYQGLDQVSRRKVWQILLERAHAYSGLSEEHLDALAKEPLNRKQIKNVVKAAKLLAIANDVALNADHIQIMFQVMRKAQIPGTFRSQLSN